MKKASHPGQEKRTTNRSSMTVATETVCEDDACIGKTDLPAGEPATATGEPAAEPPESAQSSMTFAGKSGCKDDACIGKS